MIINRVLWFDEPVDWDRCKAVFLERIVERFPRFRQRAADGLPARRPHWEDDRDFEPELHFHRLAVPGAARPRRPPGPRLRRIRRRWTIPPLWEVYLLEGYGAGCASSSGCTTASRTASRSRA